MPLQRKCGTCSECCFGMAVKELDKEVLTPCAHLCAKGCGIYADRPESCQGFYCFWVMDDSIHLKLKPDKIHVVFYPMTTEFGPTIAARETREGAADAPEVKEFIQKAAKRYPVIIMEFTGGRRLVGGTMNDFQKIKSKMRLI